MPTHIDGRSDHLVDFYRDDGDLVARVVRYLSARQRAGDALVVIATPAHRRSVEDELDSAGFVDGVACANDELVMVDAATALELERLCIELARRVDFLSSRAYRSPTVEGDAGGSGASQSGQAQFPAEAGSPGAARRYLLGLLEHWGRSDQSDDAALVVTELATNAICHARSPFTLRVELSRSTVRISVSDASTRPPELRYQQLDLLGGRGLALVAMLCEAWGYEPHAGGKEVWAEISVGRVTDR